MHYYKRNIGDYHRKAGRLSMIEHGAFTLLIDSCYDRERFPTEEEAIKWAWARTDEEIEAVRFVLDRFFELEDGVYVQTRIAEELNAYKQQAETNKRIAKEREDKRRTDRERKSTKREQKSTVVQRSVNEACTDREQDVNASPPNHKPLTINQEPRTKNHKPILPDATASVTTPDKPAKTRRVKPEAFKSFFAAYPQNKKGGRDDTAWKKFKSLKLSDDDAASMFNDVVNRKSQCKSWNDRFAPAICRYMEERIWLTPIFPDKPTGQAASIEDDYADLLDNLPPIAEQPGRTFEGFITHE